jgi:hypothetical protein
MAQNLGETTTKPPEPIARKKIPGLPKVWQEFLFCVILHMLLPLLPLLLELWQAGAVTGKELSLAASMYAVSIGVSSRNKAIFALGVFISIAFASAYGFQSPTSGGVPLRGGIYIACISILLILITHCCERYNMHVVDGVPFWEFQSEKEVKGSSNA